MIICCVWSEEKSNLLLNNCKEALQELGLLSDVVLKTSNDPAYRELLKISQDPALCIEEDAIEFKDMIFEWTIPSPQELSSLFVSVFGISEGQWGCGSCSTWGCGSCSTGCHT